MNNKNIFGIDFLKKAPFLKTNDIVWGTFEFIHTSLMEMSKERLEMPPGRIYVYDTNPQGDNFFDKVTNQKLPFNFVGITLITLRDSYISSKVNDKDYKIISNACELLRKKFINTKNYEVEFYGSLNSHDICAICCFDDFEKFITFVENIQKAKDDDNSEIFSSSYTMVTSFKLSNEEENLFSNSNGFANIQLTYNNWIDLEKILIPILDEIGCYDNNNIKENYKNNIKIYSTLGEYDISIRLPIRLLTNTLYTKLLNPESELDYYKNNIQQCYTRFSKEINSDKYSKKIPCNINKGNINPSEKKRKRNNDNNPFIEDMLDILEYEYYRAMQMTDSTNDKNDLEIQYKATCKVINDILREYKEENLSNLPFSYIKDLVEIFKQTIYRIVQNGNYDIDIIQSLFRNIASHDKIIKCYYNIVKNILTYVYLYGNKNQSELIPFINFEAVPLVSSKLFNVLSKEEQKILSIYLPYDAFHNIDAYYPLMYHEIGHYISPTNRSQRNYYGLVITCCIFFCKLSETIIPNDMSSIIKATRNTIIEIIDLKNINYINFEASWNKFYQILQRAYRQICNKDNIEKYDDVNELSFLIKNLKNAVFQQIGKDKLNINTENSINIWNEIDGVLSGIREATADKFMIKHTKLEAEDYISLIVFSRYRQTILKDETLQACTRVPLILKEHYKLNENERQDIFTKAADICKKVYSCSNNNQLTNILTDIERACTQFDENYLLISDLMNEMINTLDFNEFDNDNNKLWKEQNKIYNNKQDDWMINLINLSYNQISFEKLKELKNINNNESNNTIKFDKINIDTNYPADANYCYSLYEYVINDIGDFNSALKQMYNFLSDNNEKLWFRGQSNINWDLKSSLFRIKDINHYNYLLDAYNEFVALSSRSLELQGTLTTEADWIAYMQHYFIPTHFLDWTEQPLTALFFALDSFFIPKCLYMPNDGLLSGCTSTNKDGKYFNEDLYQDAVIWVLNPYRMNNTLYNDQNSIIKNGIIPNLSIGKNINDETKRFLFEPKNDLKDLFNDKKKYILKHKPLAISTSILSDRITKQKGHFVAMDFQAESDLYSYVNNNNNHNTTEASKAMDIISSLNEYHKYWFKDKNNEIKPFLAKIIIPQNLKEDFVKYLKYMNVYLANIYPELENIGRDIAKFSQNNQSFMDL